MVEQITPPSRPIADWDAVVERQSYWTLHEAYHNLVPANASKGTWPLSPVDKQFEYIPTYVNDGGSCELKGTQGTAQCGAQIFSYLEQLEPVSAATVSASSVTRSRSDRLASADRASGTSTIRRRVAWPWAPALIR